MECCHDVGCWREDCGSWAGGRESFLPMCFRGDEGFEFGLVLVREFFWRERFRDGLDDGGSEACSRDLDEGVLGQAAKSKRPDQGIASLAAS